MSIIYLIRNEWKKCYSPILMVFLIVTIIISHLISVQFNASSYSDKWKEQLEAHIVDNNDLLNTFPDNDDLSSEIKLENDISRYRIENNIPPYDGILSFIIKSSSSCLPLLILIICIVSCRVFGVEYSEKTITAVLTQNIPVRMIISAKFLFLTTIIVMIELLYYTSYFFICLIRFGATRIFNPIIEINAANTVVQIEAVDGLCYTMQTTFIVIITYALLSALLTIVIKRQNYSIMLMLIFHVLGQSIIGLFPFPENIKIFLLPNSIDCLKNLSTHLSSIYDNITVLSIWSCVVHCVIIVIVSFAFFILIPYPD